MVLLNHLSHLIGRLELIQVGHVAFSSTSNPTDPVVFLNSGFYTGEVSDTAGSGDMKLQYTNIESGKRYTFTNYSLSFPETMTY